MKPLTNRLSESTSTYLQQHLDNPVHWQLWDQQALSLAKKLDKPILLSIGYAACHWCHVMAHESFEDPAMAALMNEHFINIKVDRQERPDLDSQYQLTHQLFTRRAGGWPLTVFLDPQDLTPFFAGTYFPPRPSRGMPGFADVLRQLNKLFQDRREDLQQQAQQIRAALAEISQAESTPQPLDKNLLKRARERLLDSIDKQYGGIGGAPKFPRCPELNLLEQFARQDDAECAAALRDALQAMLNGGLYDHLGGGFYRYCVDGQWDIPHFEKMLYDNAQLLPLLAAQADHLNNARTAINATVAWLDRRMALPAGADQRLYAAALDADSLDGSGHSSEGAYYLWQPAQVQAVLSADEYPEFARHYGLEQPANFENQAWHLRCQPDQAPNPELDEARQKLLLERQQRPLPTLDTQALCGWNGLLALGLLRAGYSLSDAGLYTRGRDLIASLWNSLWQPDEADGVLHQRYAGDAAHGQAFLEDAASLLLAMISALQHSLQPDSLRQCQQLADYLLAHFYDAEHGGFWLSPPDYSDLLIRSKPWLDDATPAGNALACQALLKLGHLTGTGIYLDAVETSLQAAQDDLQRYPGAAGSSLLVLDQWFNPPAQLLAHGEFSTAERNQWLARSDVSIYFIERSNGWSELPDNIITAFTQQAHAQAQTVMVCQATRCLSPCASLSDAEQLLD